MGVAAKGGIGSTSSGGSSLRVFEAGRPPAATGRALDPGARPAGFGGLRVMEFFDAGGGGLCPTPGTRAGTGGLSGRSPAAVSLLSTFLDSSSGARYGLA